jgi:quinol monooxygenase YgiN
VSELIVIAIMKPKPGREAEALEHRKRKVEVTHAEDDGCYLYALHRDLNEPGQLVIIERWESRAHLTAHARADHSVRSLKELEDLLVEPASIMYLEAIPAGDPVKGAL